MPSIRAFVIITLLVAGCGSKMPKSYDFTPALLHLDKYRQSDTLGFNLASEIPKMLYGRILSEDVALWASPAKDIKISKETFMESEKKANAPFVESQHFFIHQVWRIYKKNFSFGVIGFSFTGESRSGRKINYGFVDANDVIALMKDRYIPANANGSAYLSYWDALHSMQYDFDLVQFGKEDFKDNMIRSFEIKQYALKEPSLLRDFTPIPNQKELQYRVMRPALSSNPANALLYNSMEKFVNANRQTILNAGGSDFLSHLNPEDWKIDNIVVTEYWSKFDRIPYQELRYLDLFIKSRPIRLNREDLAELNVMIGLQTVDEFLSEKRFGFVLNRVNQQEIPSHESTNVYNALWSKDWNKLSTK